MNALIRVFSMVYSSGAGESSSIGAAPKEPLTANALCLKVFLRKTSTSDPSFLWTRRTWTTGSRLALKASSTSRMRGIIPSAPATRSAAPSLTKSFCMSMTRSAGRPMEIT